MEERKIKIVIEGIMTEDKDNVYLQFPQLEEGDFEVVLE